jgi:hypothetical protein
MGIIPSFSVSDVVELIKKGSTIEAQERIMDLRAAALDLQQENLSLREQVQALEAQLRLREDFQWDGVVYWAKEQDGKRDGPFCPRCKDGNSKLARLFKLDRGQGRYLWACSVCGKDFYPSRGDAPAE